jgi:SAM-dependent methyltransferase
MDEPLTGAGTAQLVGEQAFDAYYFANCCGKPYRRDDHWLGFFGAIAEQISTRIQPRRVLDAGCALGLLVEGLRARGVDAEGIDISSYAIANVFEPMKPFCRQGSIADEFPERYDLIVSIEVLEHMPAAEGERAIANVCRHTDDVLFSSSPTDHRETSHVNVQPAEYWAEVFARQGFYRDVDFDASFVTPWAVRFRRRADPLPRIVRDYERRFAWLLSAQQGARAYAVDVQQDLAKAQDQVRSLDTARDDETARRAALERVVAELAAMAAALKARESDRAMFAREIAAMRQALDETDAQLTRRIVASEALQETAARTDYELRHARETIALMESSMFWRARRVWAGLKRALGLGA